MRFWRETIFTPEITSEGQNIVAKSEKMEFANFHLTFSCLLSLDNIIQHFLSPLTPLVGMNTSSNMDEELLRIEGNRYAPPPGQLPLTIRFV